jgi:hypothetical protein
MKRLLITSSEATQVIFQDALVNIEKIAEFDNTGFKNTADDAPDNPILWLRGELEFSGKAFGLSPAYDWQVGKDSEGTVVLVPILRK